MKKKFFKGILLAVFAAGAFTACSSDNGEADIDGPDTGEVTAKFKHRVLIEDFTGAWCGWCPRVSHAIELLKETPEADSYVFGAIHNGDAMTVSGTSGLPTSLWTKFEIPSAQRGYPFAAVNRMEEWKTPEPNNLKQVKDLIQTSGVPVGIKIASTLTATGGTVNFSLKLGATYNAGLKYVCYVIENNVVKTNNPQQNYTDYYGGVDVIPDFKHYDVFLKSTGPVAGTAITAEQTKSGAEINFNQTIAYTSHTGSLDNIEVVVMALNDKGDVVNVRKAKANTTADYEKM